MTHMSAVVGRTAAQLVEQMHEGGAGAGLMLGKQGGPDGPVAFALFVVREPDAAQLAALDAMMEQENAKTARENAAYAQTKAREQSARWN